jgi:fibronectin-binding autotransporter adhesin
MKSSLHFLKFIAIALSLQAPAQAVTFFWDGTSTNANANGGNGTWNTVLTNWDSLASAGVDTAWPSTGTDNDATFGGSAGTVTIDTGGVTANDLTFSTTNYVIGGAGLTLNGALPVINVTGTATINSSISSSVTGGFSKTGTGTLILGGANSFGTSVTMVYGGSSTNFGAIRLAHNNALGGVSILNGGSGTGATQARIELSNNITVTGIELRGGGRSSSQTTGATLVNISGDNTWAGAVRAFNTGGGHGIRSDAGTLTISGGVNSNIGARTWEIGGTGNVTITGAVTTAVAITKFGVGTLTLSGSGNTYTGDTKAGAGTLVINHANALSGSALDMATADTGTVSFGPTITAATLGSLKGSRNLSLNNTAAIPAAVTLTVGANNATNSYTGQLSGLGHIYKSGTGTQTLDPGAAASMSIGSLSANSGTLILKSGTFATTAKDPSGSLSGYNIGAGARGGILTIDGATLNVGGGNNLKIAATASGTLNILSGTVTSTEVIIGHNGAGVATQSGGTVTTTNLYHQDGGAGNSYTLTGGSLTARRIFNNTTGVQDFTLNLNGGTLSSAASTTNLIDNHNTGAQITVLLGPGNTSIDTTASSASIVRPMGNMASETGTFTKAGTNTLTLTAANTYTGATRINGGTLAITGTGSIANSSTIIVGASTTFDVSGVTGGFTLGTNQTLSGPGSVNGAMDVSGTLSPGSSPGTLTTGSQTWLNGGDYNWQILDANGAAGTGYDTVAISGTLDLTELAAGGFNINLWSLASTGPDVSGNALSFLATSNYSWTLASASSGILGFDAADFLLNIGSNNGTGGFSNDLAGGMFSVSQSGNNLLLNFTAVPEPGSALLGGLGLLALLRRRR